MLQEVEMKGVYRASDRSFTPWKNGGGQTAEILALPKGAALDGFDIRLSTAVVASDGPFSSFTGINRVLTVLEGGPMLLTIEGRELELTDASAPFAFSGALPCAARLAGPQVLDFNVMTRAPLRAEVTRGPLAPVTGSPQAAYALLLAPQAGLERLDLVDLLEADPALLVALQGASALRVICG
ncbi:HutD family protein [Paracoccus sulfuroxidans]|uniref:HutD protein n=1 Tax=Paracoccus sulfuroxidans TaxID=384678 RepID=A0A562NY51_9RHOB|nr:HutD family protein [Paracoccus sulfuroxidans]TWI37162.1 hypothetical protein IQ24_00954 [Paracoccus sulfuroxidans]